MRRGSEPTRSTRFVTNEETQMGMIGDVFEAPDGARAV